MSKLKDIVPTIVLFLICALITLALAMVYRITEPIINQNEIDAANIARQEVLPQGDTFTKIENITLPDGVKEAYKADNGEGYVFTSSAQGFGGEVVYMVGMDMDNSITGIVMFSHSETPGLGTKVSNPEYLANYYGEVNPDDMDAITGATITSNSLKTSLNETIQAYNSIKEAA